MSRVHKPSRTKSKLTVYSSISLSSDENKFYGVTSMSLGCCIGRPILEKEREREREKKEREGAKKSVRVKVVESEKEELFVR